ncbi:hypothetical protein ABIB25_000969 [Nakamurella sp. UYEF19]|uniref:hypothetical protein n=1 Tax=Nakamurella sp. UYEF19 TaxID=1756392 RepID=UPI003390B7D0
MGAERHSDLVALCKSDHERLHLIWDSSPQWRRLPRAVGSPALVATMAAEMRRLRRPAFAADEADEQ